MIWGMTLEPGKLYTEVMGDEVHLSMASIESRKDFAGAEKPDTICHIIMKTDKSEYLLCTLVNGITYQQSLDLKLMPREKVTFSVQGSNVVYLTGYSSSYPDLDDPLEDDEFSETGDWEPYETGDPSIESSEVLAIEDEEMAIKDESEDVIEDMADDSAQQSSPVVQLDVVPEAIQEEQELKEDVETEQQELIFSIAELEANVKEEPEENITIITSDTEEKLQDSEELEQQHTTVQQQQHTDQQTQQESLQQHIQQQVQQHVQQQQQVQQQAQQHAQQQAQQRVQQQQVLQVQQQQITQQQATQQSTQQVTQQVPQQIQKQEPQLIQKQEPQQVHKQEPQVQYITSVQASVPETIQATPQQQQPQLPINQRAPRFTHRPRLSRGRPALLGRTHLNQRHTGLRFSSTTGLQHTFQQANYTQIQNVQSTPTSQPVAYQGTTVRTIPQVTQSSQQIRSNPSVQRPVMLSQPGTSRGGMAGPSTSRNNTSTVAKKRQHGSSTVDHGNNTSTVAKKRQHGSSTVDHGINLQSDTYTSQRLTMSSKTTIDDHTVCLTGGGGCRELPNSSEGVSPVLHSMQSGKSKKVEIQCRHCSKVYKWKADRNRHELSHFEIKPYMCQYCSRMFIRKVSCVTHEELHRGVRSYECQYCRKGFNWKNARNFHEKTCKLKQKPH